MKKTIPCFYFFSSEDSDQPDDLEAEGPGGEGKLGDFQILDRLERISDKLNSK